MSSKKIRDGFTSNDNAVFLTQFNSSSVYALGVKQGEAQVSLLIAIEYPDKYRSEKNWLTTSIIVRVTEQLSVGVPEFINNVDK